MTIATPGVVADDDTLEELVELKTFDGPVAWTWLPPQTDGEVTDAGDLLIVMRCKSTGCEGEMYYIGALGTVRCKFDEDGVASGSIVFAWIYQERCLFAQGEINNFAGNVCSGNMRVKGSDIDARGGGYGAGIC